ncbi:IclR family transcriptional regulator [Streptomyces sp. SID13031]|uniref:IclR family transcriptional regulator n=1 Tax=Streptomyces sp. SID13031 TaxID=2706046 RepID=UPI0013C57D77|nr:IclR family transcriptional regulator [Streptomyces sp. SID13031]NEA32850.1 IclR family transcriptional regulator [Streptomyces sp. SID13031]
MEVAGTAASKLLSVLSAFTEQRPALTLTEIAAGTALPLSTAHRLVGELAAWGALERGPDARYRIGLRLWELASLAPRGLPLREAALPFLEDLYEATHENVQLSVLDGDEVVYVERLSGRRAVKTRTRVGGRLTGIATAGGRVLLAHAPAEVVEKILAEPVIPYTPQTVTDAATLRGLLAEVRRQGLAVDEHQVTAGAIAVAAPIRNRYGEVIAAVSVVAKAEPGSARILTPLVTTTASAVSRALGFKGTRRRS